MEPVRSMKPIESTGIDKYTTITSSIGYKMFIGILPKLINIESYFTCPGFIKLVALSNVCEKLFPNFNTEINSDIRIISKSIKYSAIFRPCRMEIFFTAATRIIERASSPITKADYNLKLAKSILKISPHESVEYALKAFKLIKKSNECPHLKYKIIKIILTAKPTIAYKAAKSLNNSDGEKIKAFYKIYKNSYEKLAVKCFKQIEKLIWNRDIPEYDRLNMRLKFINQNEDRVARGIRTYLQQEKKIYNKSSTCLPIAFKAYQTFSEMQNFRLADDFDFEIKEQFKNEMDTFEIIENNIYVGKKLTKNQPFVAQEYFVKALEEVRKLAYELDQIRYISRIFKLAPNFLEKDIQIWYITASEILRKISTYEEQLHGFSMVITTIPFQKCSINIDVLPK